MPLIVVILQLWNIICLMYVYCDRLRYGDIGPSNLLVHLHWYMNMYSQDNIIQRHLPYHTYCIHDIIHMYVCTYIVIQDMGIYRLSPFLLKCIF